MINWLMMQIGVTGNFNNLLATLENLAFFDVVLPFLLIFALIFGILSKIRIFEDNRGVNAIISLSIGLLALASGFVAEFFPILFPRAAIGLSILLVAMILIGVFIPLDKDGWGNYIFMGLGIIIFLIVIFYSLDEFSYFAGGFTSEALSSLIVGILIIAAIVFIIVGTGKKGGGGHG